MYNHPKGLARGPQGVLIIVLNKLSLKAPRQRGIKLDYCDSSQKSRLPRNWMAEVEILVEVTGH